MKKKKEPKSSVILLVIIVIAFIIAAYFIFRPASIYQPPSYNQPTPTITQSSSQIYRSGILKFTINVPSKFQIQERSTTILIKYNNREIQINRSGTNFSTLNAYLDNLSKLNHFTFSSRENVTIGNYSSVKGLINEEGYYFIYADNWVYSLYQLPSAF